MLKTLPLRLGLKYEYPGYVEKKGQPPSLHGLLEVSASPETSFSSLQKNTACQISLVVDESMSMNMCMPVVRQTLLFLLGKCPDGTRVSLTGFSDEALVYASNALSTDSALHNHVRQLSAKSTTNLHAGVLAGLRAFEEQKCERGRRCLVLLTDGEANAGLTDPRSIYASVKNRMNGVHFCALAIGKHCNMDLLSELTMQAEGRCLCIEETHGIPKAIGSLFGGLLTPGPRQVRVRFPSEVDPSVSGLPLAQGTSSVVVLGDMSLGENVSIPFLATRTENGERGALWFEAVWQEGKEGTTGSVRFASPPPLECCPAGARRDARVALHLLRVRIAFLLQKAGGEMGNEEPWRQCLHDIRSIEEDGLSEDLKRLRALLLLRAGEALKRASGQLPSLTLPELKRAATTELTRQISQEADGAFATPHMRALAEQAEQSIGRGRSVGEGGQGAGVPGRLAAPHLTRS